MFNYEHLSRYFEDLMLYDLSVYENKIVRLRDISKTVPTLVLKSKCRLSFKSSVVTDEGLTSKSSLLATLFVPSGVIIKEGAKCEVNQLGSTYDVVVGRCKVYVTHFEYEVREFIKRV